MLERSKLSNRARRRLGAVLAAAAAAAAVPTSAALTASPAHAYTCRSTYTASLNDGSASASIRMGVNCSDGRAHITGSVSDIKCDGRRAELHLRFYNGSNLLPFRHEYPTASNGCNTSASFSYSSTNTRPYLNGCVYALNSGPTQSSGRCGWVGGSQP